MKKRILGRTGLEVGNLGLGTEYLVGQDQNVYSECIKICIDSGINYIDVIFAFPDYRDRLGKAMHGLQDRFVIAGHIGCAETDGQCRKSRDANECSDLFSDLLERLDIDRAQIAMIQFVDADRDYERVMGPGGLYELAQRLKQEGKADHIGISIHDYASAGRAAASGAYDVIMFPLGIILAPIPVDEFSSSCRENNVGVVAMKFFGGGRLFRLSGTLGIDPSRLVGFPLVNPDVSTNELQRAISGMNNMPPAADLKKFTERIQGRPENTYADLGASASSCTECGVCETRCPFEVPVMARMMEAADVFSG